MPRQTDSSSIPSAEGSHSFRRKLYAMPDWLLGILVGAIASAVSLLVLVPRMEYAHLVKDPADQVIAKTFLPLSAEEAQKLGLAREQLAKGKVDAALQNLNAVLSTRPDNQEARWLLASTYDRWGDRKRAARHYRIFIAVESRERAIRDERVKRAQQRLGKWEEMP